MWNFFLLENKQWEAEDFLKFEASLDIKKRFSGEFGQDLRILADF